MKVRIGVLETDLRAYDREADHDSELHTWTLSSPGRLVGILHAFPNNSKWKHEAICMSSESRTRSPAA